MKRAYLLSVEGTASVEEAARRNHYEGEALTGSFWSKAAASLPPHVRRRYGHLFMAAEQYEPIVDSIVEGSRAIARRFSTGSKRRDVKRHGTLARRHA
jgi:hypothetical protein